MADDTTTAADAAFAEIEAEMIREGHLRVGEDGRLHEVPIGEAVPLRDAPAALVPPPVAAPAAATGPNPSNGTTTGPYLPQLESPANKYWPVLCKLMEFHHGAKYPAATTPQFEPDVLGTLTPKQVERWMNISVFGMADPPNGANPTCGRSASLEFYKKAVSFFMPNKLMAWNSLTNTGNPTRSLEVNNLIKRVRKHEVRRTGKASQARRKFSITLNNRAIVV